MLSTFYGSAPIEIAADERAKTNVSAEQTSPMNQPLTLEEYVRLYYYKTPILAEIARCESRFRHTGADGRVIRGEASWEDVGVMQINEFYHEDRAKKLGMNLHTLDGNLAYAKCLYGKEGGAVRIQQVLAKQRYICVSGKNENKLSTKTSPKERSLFGSPPKVGIRGR
jgi:hypothetical protein